MTHVELLNHALCCNRCGTCRGVTQDTVPDVAFSTQCPCGMTLYGAHEPAGLMYLARGIAQGDLKWNQDLARVLYSCTMCGYCDDFCQRGYRHTPAIAILEELRSRVPDRLRPAGIKNAAQSLAVPKNHRLGLLEKFGLYDVAPGRKAATVLFADDTLLGNGPKLKELGFILQKAGVKAGCFISSPLPPVSAALMNGGCGKELGQAMAAVDAALAAHGVKKVIVYNPESLSVLKRFSASGADFVSVTSLYADMLRRKKTKKIKLPPVTYQDPCHLGRYAGQYAAPRETIARLGLQLKEMWRRGADALCCGAGGGVLADNPDLAKRYAVNRWREARATGAQVMITACPYCQINMNRSKPGRLKVVDLTSLVAQALGYTGKEMSK